MDGWMDQLIGLIAGHTTTYRSEGFVVDKVLDKTGMKGTGRWTVQEGAERSVPVSTMTAALDARYLSARKDEVSKQASKQEQQQHYYQCGCRCSFFLLFSFFPKFELYFHAYFLF